MTDINEVNEDENVDVAEKQYSSANSEKCWRNLVGFWLLGLCNNYPYVIMLSAAFDLLHSDYHEDPNPSNSSCPRNDSMCNSVSTGAILLADIIPSLLIKVVAPFIAINTQNVVSTWASGTGGAGVIGALSYASLKAFFDTRPTLQIMLVMPVITALTFWILIRHPQSKRLNCRELCRCSAEAKPILEGEIDMATKEYVRKPSSYTLKEKISLTKPLLKYMLPLGLVYFAEYFINQGLMELLYFKNASNWLCHKVQYRWYQVDYQVGVLISRSSVNILKVNKLWILPILQFINVIFLLFNVYYAFLPNIWIVFAIIFYEGLLGGCSYVNTFYKITVEVAEKDREFSMGVASVGDSVGIALAGIVSLPVHEVLCKLPAYM
ncbi:battenin isoform X2 [Parasteatoda tepidariorum]|uniref:battenin isoform X2 n=1 Tax=Parasteatoda tepidariorum TaxID=114398 RepID=UPI00077FA3FC|nr:battenin isoform X3 [Parasteatoda tepidariorum]